jgi:hypothetical protein
MHSIGGERLGVYMHYELARVSTRSVFLAAGER